MIIGDLTLKNLHEWEDSTNDAQEIIDQWKKQILSSDRPTKKQDLRQLAILQLQIDRAEKALQSLGWELNQREQHRKSNLETHKKLQRYCRALGGDPSLIYWHKDSDFV